MPWLKGSDVLLREGTKFYVQVTDDMRFQASMAPQVPMSMEEPIEPVGRVTIFRCDPLGEATENVHEMKMNGRKLVSLRRNRFLILNFQDGQYNFSIGKDVLTATISFATRLYIRDSTGSDGKRALLALVDDDDCDQTIEPEDPKQVSKAWRANIQ